MRCNCGVSTDKSRVEHEFGVDPSCFRVLVPEAEIPKLEIPNEDYDSEMWSVQGHLITGRTLRFQRGYHLHNGVWSVWASHSSENSVRG